MVLVALDASTRECDIMLYDIYLMGMYVTFFASAILCLISHIQKGTLGVQYVLQYIGDLMAACVMAVSWFISFPLMIYYAWTE